MSHPGFVCIRRDVSIALMFQILTQNHQGAYVSSSKSREKVFLINSMHINQQIFKNK
jgi:hypothetical protein